MAYAEVAGLPPVVGLWAIVGPLRRLRPARLVAAAVGRAGVDHRADDRGRRRAARRRRPGPVRRAGRRAGPGRRRAVPARPGSARLGFLADLLSKPVLVGYMAGVAVLMIVEPAGQGHRRRRSTGDGVRGRARLVRRADLGRVHRPTVLLAAGRPGAAARRAAALPARPGPLHRRSLVAAVAVAVFVARRPGRRGWSARSPAGCPTPRLPGVGRRRSADAAAARRRRRVVGYTDNVLTARAFAARNGDRDRRQPGAARARRGQPGGRRCAGLPGQQQRQPHRDRRRARQPHASCTRWSRWRRVVAGAAVPAARLLASVPDRRARARSSSTRPCG